MRFSLESDVRTPQVQRTDREVEGAAASIATSNVVNAIDSSGSMHGTQPDLGVVRIFETPRVLLQLVFYCKDHMYLNYVLAVNFLRFLYCVFGLFIMNGIFRKCMLIRDCRKSSSVFVENY